MKRLLAAAVLALGLASVAHAAIDISGPDSAFDLDAIEGRYLAAVRAATSTCR